MIPLRFLVPCVGYSLLACGGASSLPTGPSSVPASEAGVHASALEYLLERHDVDSDGEISAQEYDRTPRAFARLDRNRDGVVSAGDFLATPRGGSRKRAERAALLVAQFLQTDGDRGRIEADELRSAFAAYDTDGDDRIGEGEFRCGMGQLAPAETGPQSRQALALLRGIDPWLGLLGGIDSDLDGWIARSELLDFFRSRSDGKPWRIAQGDEVLELEVAQRPLEGRVAPDFTLQSLGGGAPVTLSSFVGDQPVALIFGSYT
ncbi:MAG: Ca2+-binding EF-hand superfamily protein [Planctomycetota bacterium]|jgi:Ca2+-binding EF-hand superfamily protein